MINKVFAISKNTFTEALRQPIYTVIIVFSLFLMFLSPALTMFTMDDDIKMLREVGLSTLFLSGLFIAIFTATGAITEEIETKTITTVLSKPIARPTFILGKFFGVTAAVLLGHFICTAAYLLAVRHGVVLEASDEHDWVVIYSAIVVIAATIILTAFLNYSYDWSFSSTSMRLLAGFMAAALVFLSFIDKHWRFNPAENGFGAFDIYASVLLFMAIIVLASLAIMFSTRLNVVLTMTCCVGVFLLGLINDYLFARFADQHIWAKIGRAIVPNLQVFWISDAIYGDSAITVAHVGQVAIYSILYTLGILCLATALFQKKQVG